MHRGGLQQSLFFLPIFFAFLFISPVVYGETVTNQEVQDKSDKLDTAKDEQKKADENLKKANENLANASEDQKEQAKMDQKAAEEEKKKKDNAKNTAQKGFDTLKDRFNAENNTPFKSNKGGENKSASNSKGDNGNADVATKGDSAKPQGEANSNAEQKSEQVVSSKEMQDQMKSNPATKPEPSAEKSSYEKGVEKSLAKELQDGLLNEKGQAALNEQLESKGGPIDKQKATLEKWATEGEGKKLDYSAYAEKAAENGRTPQQEWADQYAKGQFKDSAVREDFAKSFAGKEAAEMVKNGAVDSVKSPQEALKNWEKLSASDQKLVQEGLKSQAYENNNTPERRAELLGKEQASYEKNLANSDAGKDYSKQLEEYGKKIGMTDAAAKEYAKDQVGKWAAEKSATAFKDSTMQEKVLGELASKQASEQINPSKQSNLTEKLAQSLSDKLKGTLESASSLVPKRADVAANKFNSDQSFRNEIYSKVKSSVDEKVVSAARQQQALQTPQKRLQFVQNIVNNISESRTQGAIANAKPQVTQVAWMGAADAARGIPARPPSGNFTGMPSRIVDPVTRNWVPNPGLSKASAYQAAYNDVLKQVYNYGR
jgi:hypothetical protein